MSTSPADPDAGDGVERTPVEARQAVTTGHMRWVLRISLGLGVVALGAVLIGYVSMQHQHPDHGANVAPPVASSTPHDTGAS